VLTLNRSNFDREVFQREKVAFVHFYDKDDRDHAWEEMTSKYKEVVLMGEYNCEEEEDW